MTRRLPAALALLAVVLGVAQAPAQTYPNRPIHMVVPHAPGGGVATGRQEILHVARSSGQWADDESIDPAGRRRGRSLRWALGVLLALLMAAGGTYWRWGANAERALNEAVDELRRNGQPVEAADLVGPPVPGADNAAMQYAGIALKMVRRNVCRFNYARLYFVDVQMQTDGVFQAADKAHA